MSDIDECVVDTHHNCSSDAFCNNTHGSFNCTCKTGFIGDGENCTGSFLSVTCVLVWHQKLYLFSIILFPLQLASYSDATTEVDAGEVD